MHMPEMGGRGLLAALNERGSSMPVIIVTANAVTHRAASVI
jgi:FixJ family two-component response regulator